MKTSNTNRSEYLMESTEETLRLDLKTDAKIVEQQALWAGIKPGMRVADLGFGSGKTTFYLHKLVQPNGEVVGVDIAEDRINYAKKNYNKKGIEYILKDIREPLDNLGMFDFIWVRFVLEYYRSESFNIVKNISSILKPGGIICLIDLDYNCLNHFGLSKRLKRTIHGVTKAMEKNADFDPYVGIKLYSFLYDLGYQNIDVSMAPHHLIFGELNKRDAFNWTKKLEVAVKRLGYDFKEYNGGYEEFFEEFTQFFSDPRRFTYTPLISCKGRKALN
ncbi:MAG: class I SAM-dependent methyltransferase [Desulfobacteraceae bacterium]|nr:class I SAM-dependent methyltransferase [Desulfobacteraceae bacterium]